MMATMSRFTARSTVSSLAVVAVALAAGALAGCGDDGGASAGPTVYFELDGALAGGTFWDLPYPSDLRLTAGGSPDVTGFPNRRDLVLVRELLAAHSSRRGFPVMPVSYVRFSAAPPARSPSDVIPAQADAPVLLLDIDLDSPERGRLAPVVAGSLVRDDYAPDFLVGFAPRPGVVLRADTTYALVVRRAFAPDAAPPASFAALAAGDTPPGRLGAAAAALYTPLWPALAELGVDVGDVLVASVFTTGDEVALLRARSEAVRASHDAIIEGLHVDPVDGAGQDGFCELIGTVRVPVLQRGTPPYNDDGQFVLDGDGVPVAQGEVSIPLTITLPLGTMPAAGWPLYQFFHGSGGVSSGVVDLGRIPAVGAEPEVGRGPGWVVARHGIAAASTALPANPERLPGADDYAYLNINNLAAFPYTFQQGVIEQRLLLDALLALRVAPATVAACAGLTLPAGATAHQIDPAKLVAGGQSMGGMYTNMVGAVEPRFGALVPTGAGGLWNLMAIESAAIPNGRVLLATLFGTDPDQLAFVHPMLGALATAWEIAEPMASMARLARRPLPGHPVRHVYEPVGQGDEYFPTTIFDAAALAYGNTQAGELVWAPMQDALGLDGLGGVAAYPITGNRPGAAGAPASTNVVVQFRSDGIANSHYIYRQLDEVKHQYGCFLASYLATGTPTVPAPAAVTTPCP